MDDILILGGGVIGLSLAYQLSKQQQKVRVIDRGVPGKEASWAGAGMLPASGFCKTGTSEEQLFALSTKLHREWSVELRNETGIDNGYRACGAIYLGFTSEDAEQLSASEKRWKAEQLSVNEFDAKALQQVEPKLLCAERDSFRTAYQLPEEAQIRNPRHLKALIAACRQQGVAIESGVAAEDFEIHKEMISSVQTSQGKLSAGKIIVTSGAWSGLLLRRLGIEIPIKPIRGQIALLAMDQLPFRHIINVGERYLVPRPDGRILIGSTQEDVGFLKQTTASGISGLLDFGIQLVPELALAHLEKTWAGLRPNSLDGLPFIGALPTLKNGFLASGHFRNGLTLSTGTAVVLAQLICGETPEIDLTPFAVERAIQ